MGPLTLGVAASRHCDGRLGQSLRLGTGTVRMGTTGKPIAPGRVRLRLLATSDVHAHLLAWDYYADRPAPGRGLARLATLAARARRGADLSLLVDNGDFLQGSPLGDAAALGAALDQGRNPIVAAMNAMGYDAAALGNHEFSHGLDRLMAAAAQAKFPILSANILTTRGAAPEADRTLFPATALIARSVAGRSLTVGLIGLTPPQTLAWEANHIDRPLFARSIVEAASAQARSLRARGADIVVALCHAGIRWNETDPVDNEAAAVAGLAGIDAVVAGHSHRIFPDPDLELRPGFDPKRGRIHGRPVVAPGFFGSHLGVIDLVLAPDDRGWKITGRRARLIPVARRNADGRLAALAPEDTDLRAIALPAHDATRTWAGQTIGASPHRMSTHFALVAPCEAVRLVARAKALAVRAALAGTLHADLPILAASAPYRAGGRGGVDNYSILPRGPLSLRNLADIYPFPNSIVALRLTGAEVIRWLERAAGLFQRISPGAQDVPLIDPSFPSFNFDSIEGLSYRFALDQPALYDHRGQPTGSGQGRLRDVRLNGQPLDPAQPLILATNTYRLSGAGGFAADLTDRALPLHREFSRDALRHYIARLGQLPPPLPPNWGFMPMPGTSVVIESAARAVEFLDQVQGLAIRPIGPGKDGFHRFRLTLG